MPKLPFIGNVEFTKTPSLVNLFDTLTKIAGDNNPAIRTMILNGFEDGMRKEAKKLKKKGEPITLDKVMVEFNKHPRLYKICERQGISKLMIQNMARKVARDENRK